METTPVNDTRAILGEGPVWHEGGLLWVDIEGRKVMRHDPRTALDRVVPLDECVGCVWPCADGRLICGLESGLAFLDPATGGNTPIADPESHLENTRFNDGKTDPRGRFWAGTMDMGEQSPRGSLYMMDAALHVVRQFEGVTVSNGLAWDPDGRTLYYIDSPTREVWAFDYEAETGALGHRRTAVAIPEGEGYPDGMTIDAEGMIWVALWEGWGVVRYNPRSGERLGKIDLPVEKVTSCTFAGPDLDELYITSARIGLPDEALERQPFAGGLFRVRPGVRGLPIVPFRAGTLA